MAFVHSKWLKKTIGTTLAATCALTLMPTFAGAASENGVTSFHFTMTLAGEPQAAPHERG